MSLNSLINLQKNNPHGTISKKANSKIITRINWLHTIAKNKRTFNPKYKSNYWWKCNLITLTLPSAQTHTDVEIKRKLLNAFFTAAKRKWNVVHYIWKSEKQRNGNIHFHIACEVFIPYQELQSTWNNICLEHGYNIITKKGTQANSTDVHSMQKIKNAIAYMAKYLCKNEEQKNLIEGKIWGCSNSLSVLNAIEIPIDYELNNQLVDNSFGKKIFMKEFKWCTLIYNTMIEMACTFDRVAEEIKKYIHLQWDNLKNKKQKIIANTNNLCNNFYNSSTTQSQILQLQLQLSL